MWSTSTLSEYCVAWPVVVVVVVVVVVAVEDTSKQLLYSSDALTLTVD